MKREHKQLTKEQIKKLKAKKDRMVKDNKIIKK